MHIDINGIWAAVKTGDVDRISTELLKAVQGFFNYFLDYLYDKFELQ